MANRYPLTAYRGRVAAFVPRYDANAYNLTELILNNGEAILFKRSLPLLLADYLDLWALKRIPLQRLYAAGCSATVLYPLAIQPGHTLMPLRSRKPIGQRDGAYAYIEYESFRLNTIRETDSGLSVEI